MEYKSGEDESTMSTWHGESKLWEFELMELRNITLLNILHESNNTVL